MSTLTRFFPFLFLISWAKRYKGFIQSHYTKKNSKPAVFFSYPFALEIGPFFSSPIKNVFSRLIKKGPFFSHPIKKCFFPVLSKKDRFFLTHTKNVFSPSYQKRTRFFLTHQKCFFPVLSKKDRFFLTPSKHVFSRLIKKRTVFFSPIKNVFSRLIKKKGICDRHKRQTLLLLLLVRYHCVSVCFMDIFQISHRFTPYHHTTLFPHL